MGSVIVLWLFCVCLASVWGEEGPVELVVRTQQGSVRGFKQPGDSVFVFYGIPYATAPIGPYRFKAPLPAPAWFSTFDATDNTIICPQTTIYNITLENTTPKENCLIANVYVPDTDRKKLPVVVYVHGGAYQIGSGSFVQPKNLVRSKKVIAVTFNYRLGIHGFLCLGTENAPGNAAMKDQIALLRWVQKYISSYGGNPEDVTIAGCSAGSSSVDLLMLSPAARGLFHKVIPESGASLSSWSVQIDPLENAKLFAKSAGFKDVDDVYALEDFYTSASFDLLTSTGGFIDRTDATFLFSPCVEHRTREEPFLTDTPYNILKSGKYSRVPLLYGFSEMEGLIRIAEFDTWKERMNANFSEFLPTDLQFHSEEEREDVTKEIKEFYFGDKPVGTDSVLSFIDFISDTYFTYATLKCVQLHIEAGHDKIYLYEFNFVDDSAPPVPHTDNVKGANHCAQTMAVLDGYDYLNHDESNISDEYRNVKAVTREIWLNFITTGSPVAAGSSLPAWRPTGASGAPYMSLGRTLELRDEALLERRVRFWDSIYSRHYRAPQPPPAPPTRHTEL